MLSLLDSETIPYLIVPYLNEFLGQNSLKLLDRNSKCIYFNIRDLALIIIINYNYN